MRILETVAIVAGVLAYDNFVAPAIRRKLASFEGAALVVRKTGNCGCGCNGAGTCALKTSRSQDVVRFGGQYTTPSGY